MADPVDLADIKTLLEQVHSAIEGWMAQAEAAGVEEANAAKIGSVLRRFSEIA